MLMDILHFLRYLGMMELETGTMDVVAWMRPSAACGDLTTHPMY